MRNKKPTTVIPKFICGDCLEEMRRLPDASVDLVFGSPPYENCRTYGIGFALKGQAWVDWMIEVYKESLRVCRGLVAFVVQGKTRNYRWSCVPALLIADLHRAGICVREGPWYHRKGIPGSGGPDWLRHDMEFIVSATNGGRLPWSDNTAMGHIPKYGPGGEMSHRRRNGTRVNQWGGTKKCTDRRKDGTTKIQNTPSHVYVAAGDSEGYIPPTLANPGNMIHCNAGFGQMGSRLCHENEAPFSEKLAEWMIRSFAPPGGLVLDPFAGSGTVGAVAVATGRRYCLIEVRPSQVALCKRRILEAKQKLRKERQHG